MNFYCFPEGDQLLNLSWLAWLNLLNIRCARMLLRALEMDTTLQYLHMDKQDQVIYKPIRVVATTPEKTHNQKFLTFETIFNRFFVQF